MDTKKNESIEHYLTRIREEIYNLTPADDFIEALRHDLYEYQKSNPNCTEDDLESEFGSPEEIAKDFLADQDAVRPKEIAKSKKTRNIIIILLVGALLATGIYLADILSQQQTMATDVIIIED